jgi:hypothetical protein
MGSYSILDRGWGACDDHKHVSAQAMAEGQKGSGNILDHETVLQRVLGAEEHRSARHGHTSPGAIT